MKKKSHRLLGRYLTDNLQGFPSQRYEKAFLLGCVEPDYNIFTYFKGSTKGRIFEGHNYSNAQRHILRTVEKLQKRDHWLLLEYYSLGKLIHYIADAFTSPHNETYSVTDHAIYEIKLHNYLEKGILASYGLAHENICGSVAEYILMTHKQYCSASKSPTTDVQYIIDAARVVFNLLMPEEEILNASKVAI